MIEDRSSIVGLYILNPLVSKSKSMALFMRRRAVKSMNPIANNPTKHDARDRCDSVGSFTSAVKSLATTSAKRSYSLSKLGKNKVLASNSISSPNSSPIGSKSKANKGRIPVHDGWKQTTIQLGKKSAKNVPCGCQSTGQSIVPNQDRKVSLANT